MQYRTERKRSAVRGAQTWGELANGSEAHIRRAGGRIGDGVGTKFCVLTRGDLSASAGVAVVIDAQHGCMTGRGVKIHGVGMVTSKLIGCFLDDPTSRKEVMSLMGY